ncbi:hypothetical protein F0U61_14355 [Archangium violaceum]|uniref:hypothetical protein n=1 Tax=Archangium violaceum TaxID=83451 RepID=UPI002B2F3205|nr:hypothetical protein F0U61_14355 [Archangium violaceum]
MRLPTAILAVAMSSTGCSVLAPLLGSKEPSVQWPRPEELAELKPVASEADGEFNGEAALAAAAALRETARLWSGQGLFEGCPTPAAGLGATVYAWKGYYYVNIIQRFERCGGKRFRMLDWWEAFAVSPEGHVIARQPYGF